MGVFHVWVEILPQWHLLETGAFVFQAMSGNLLTILERESAGDLGIRTIVKGSHSGLMTGSEQVLPRKKTAEDRNCIAEIYRMVLKSFF